MKLHRFGSKLLNLIYLTFIVLNLLPENSIPEYQNQNEYLFIQSYTVYTEDNCQGKNETLTTSVNNLKDTRFSKLEYFGQIKSRCVFSGVWVENLEVGESTVLKSFTGDTSRYISNVADGNMGSVCITSKTSNGSYIKIKSIRRSGASDLQDTALSLFTMPNFGGDELFFDGHSLKLPYSYVFRSWGSTGGVGWTLYKSTKIDGESLCLVPNLNSNLNFHHVDYQLSMKQDIFIGSLYRGCMTKNQSSANYQLNVIDTTEVSNLPGIILYDLNRKEVFTNGRDLRLHIPIYITSYTFTGPFARNWTVYETADDKSRYKCLYNFVNASTPAEHVIVYERSVIQIRRIRIGCDGDPIVESEYGKTSDTLKKPNYSSCLQMSRLLSTIVIFNWYIIGIFFCR